MPCRIDALSHCRKRDSRQFVELTSVLRSNRSPPRKVRLQLPNLRKSQRASNVSKPVVKAEQHHLVKPLSRLLPVARLAADPVIAKAPERLRKLRIVSRDHAAFAGGQMLHRMKAKNCHVGNSANTLPMKLRAQCVAGVLNQNRAALVRDLAHLIERRRMPSVVDRDDGFCPRTDFLGDLAGIEVQRVIADIGE